jgi:hypothetical protein
MFLCLSVISFFQKLPFSQVKVHHPWSVVSGHIFPEIHIDCTIPAENFTPVLIAAGKFPVSQTPLVIKDISFNLKKKFIILQV